MLLSSVGGAATHLLFNLYLRDMSWPDSAIGLAQFTAMGTGAALTLPSAYISFRIRPFYMLFGSLVSAGLGILLLVISPSPVAIFASATLTGLSSALSSASLSPFMLRLVGHGSAPFLFSAQWSVATLGGFIGNLTGGWLSVAGYRRAFAFGLLFQAVAIFLALSLRPPHITETRKRTKFFSGLRDDWRGLVKLGTTQAFIGLGAGLFVPFINLYFKDRFDLPTETIGLLYGIQSVSLFLSGLLAPYVVSKLGKIRTVIATQALSLPFNAGLAFSWNLVISSVSFWIRGGLMNMAQPMMSNYAVESVRPEFRGTATALMSLFWMGCFSLSNLAAGFLMERWGFTAPILAGAGFYLVSTALIWWWFGRRGDERSAGRAL
ncbi:MAG: MFS transporter [candidate division WOR-3 bacterium]